ncbi:MAG: hypothetical protein RMK89_14400 [Armatimonadota bacterium]|nr:hypothetical protein [Armatimonadota bacterium]MDW8144636.1 hypothetical protein [Armatimonadota bacterium]
MLDGVKVIVFQSHCGAIATPSLGSHALTGAAFQSHCGAIATRNCRG